MARKSNGEGSINKYKNGWRATLSLGYNSNGKRIRKQFYGKTKKEVMNKMVDYKSDFNKGLIVQDEKITVQEWIKTWLFELKINELKPSTIERYSGVYDNYIKNTGIGRCKLKDLKATNIKLYYNRLIEEGKSVNIVKTVNKVLKASLNEAKKNGYIYVNVCENITLPKEKLKEEKEITVFTLDEENKLLSSIKNHKYKMVFILALGTGLRMGELIALKWSDINFKNKTLNVKRAMSRAYVFENGKKVFKIEENTPKTNSSIRTIPIPSSVLKELQEHKKKQDLFKEIYKDVYEDKNYVFANSLGEFIKPDTISRSYAKILKEARIPHKKFHSLRHTYATRLSEKGVSLKTIQKLLGHASIRMTADIYTHVMDEEKVLAVEKINDIFKKNDVGFYNDNEQNNTIQL